MKPEHYNVYREFWLDIVAKITWRDVLKSIGTEREGDIRNLKARFPDVGLDEKVDVSRFRRHTRNRTLHCYDKTLSLSAKGKLARRDGQSVTSINKGRDRKDAAHGNSEKARTYLLEQEWLREFIISRWKSGNAASRDDCKDHMIAMAPEESEFAQKFLDPARPHVNAKWATWLTRMIKVMNFSVRAKSISQKVPADWEKLARATSKDVKEQLKHCDLVLGADQTFFKFQHDSSSVIVPTSTRRVGATTSGDDKMGFTLMVTASLTEKNHRAVLRLWWSVQLFTSLHLIIAHTIQTLHGNIAIRFSLIIV